MTHRTPSFSWIHLLAAGLSLPLLGADGGCGGGDEPAVRDAGAVDAPSPIDAGPSDAGAGCALSNGRVCALGASCPSPDGCNTCSCTAVGRLACTERACVLDAGPAVDVPPATDAGPSRDAAVCDATTCGRNPFGAPNYRCDDGSTGGPTCGVRSDSTCGWYLRACPASVDAGSSDSGCVPECPAPPPGCHYEGPTSCSPPSCGRLACVDAGTEISCGATGVGSFPSFDRSCAASSDCFVATHQTDCCGNSRAMGIRASERDAFERAEAVCRPMYPGCGCPAHAPVTDDGMSSGFSSTISVECRAGTCTTFVRAS